jgi:hypothetical protein
MTPTVQRPDGRTHRDFDAPGQTEGARRAALGHVVVCGGGGRSGRVKRKTMLDRDHAVTAILMTGKRPLDDVREVSLRRLDVNDHPPVSDVLRNAAEPSKSM